MFRHSIKYNPNIAENYHLLGGLHLRKKEYERAIMNLLYAVKLCLDNDIAHGELGQAYLEAGKLDEAVILFKNALKINPGNYTHLNNLNLAKLIKTDSTT